jgi:hypothetical protein
MSFVEIDNFAKRELYQRIPCTIRDVHLAIQAERFSKHDRIAYDLPNALNRLGACGFQIGMVHSLLIVENLVALFDVKKIQGHLALPVRLDQGQDRAQLFVHDANERRHHTSRI